MLRLNAFIVRHSVIDQRPVQSWSVANKGFVNLIVQPLDAIYQSFMCQNDYTEGVSASYADCLPSPKQPEGFPGSGSFDIYLTHEPASNHSHDVPCYKTCPVVLAADYFSSHMNVEHFKVKIKASCKSSFIICLITCRRCGQQYMGETRHPLHRGINNN